MKKRLFTFFTLLLCVCSGAWAAITPKAITSSTGEVYLVTPATMSTYYNSGNGWATNGSGGAISSESYYSSKTGGNNTSYINPETEATGTKGQGSGITLKTADNRSARFYFTGAVKATAFIAVTGSDRTATITVYKVSDDSQVGTTTGASGSNGDYQKLEVTELSASESYYAKVTATNDDCLYAMKFFADAKKTTTTAITAASKSALITDINSGASAGTLAVTVTPEGESALASPSVTWSSSNEAAATINASTGEVTLVGTGTTIITASYAGTSGYHSSSDTYTLNVYNSTHSQFGYTEAISGSTLLARSLTTGSLSNISTPTIVRGADIQNYASTSKKVYINATEYTNTDTWYNSANNEYRYLGYDVTVADGYVLNLSKIDARLAVGTEAQNIDYNWYVEILDKTNNVLYTSDVQTSNKTDETSAEIADYFSLTNLTGTVHVRLYVKHSGTFKEFSINKLQLTGVTATDTRPSYTITFAAGEGTGTVPTAISTKDSQITLPGAPLLYKTGYSLKWKDADENVYMVGSTYDITADATLTAVFVENAANPWTAATTVKWTFQTSDGAPTITIEGSGSDPVVYSKSVVISENPFDALMTINAKAGKFDNSSNAGYAQVKEDTKFTIPAVYNMVVTYKYNQVPTGVTDVTFAGDDADSYDGSARTLTYTYKGAESTIDIIEKNGNKYPEWISVAYPVVPASITAPSITKGDFNFENKGYKVTITKADDYGDLMVSTDGTNYTKQTSPYVTYAATTTHYYAKTTAGALASEIADENVVNTFDGGKSYVAWVYTKGYNGGSEKPSYVFATDPMVIALQSIYNVVEINYAEGTTPSTDLKNADLIVCTEAMAGNKTMSNGIVSLIDGTTSVIGLKFFNYGNSDDATKRWKWGLPANPASTTLGFTAKNATYKLLEGVTFENDGTIKLATASFDGSSYKNVIQTANFTGANKPTDNMILGTVGSDDTKAVMHYSATKKYFGLGLSSDCWGTYTTNTTILIKNAAAMLIAGEALDATVSTVSGTISASGWNTFSSSYPLDLSTISGGTAYVATEATAGKVTLSSTTAKVAAGEGLMIKGTTGNAFTINVTTDAATLAGTNLLVGLPNGGSVAEGANNYIFGWPTVDPTGYGFYYVNESGATLGAGKAYLHTTSALAPSLSIDFGEGETTGIDAIEHGALNIEHYYDLQGRRVAQPTKGLYIVNGKKVVVK